MQLKSEMCICIPPEAKCKDWNLRTPVNGQKNCTPTSGGMTCKMTCDTDYSFYERGQEITYVCNNGQNWVPDEMIPDCLGKYRL